MSKLRVGILGLPNVGKSTLFNALTESTAAQAANYPFCTIEPNVGIVEVPDERLNELARIVKTPKIIHATVEFVDIAGLVRGASKGEGLGNKFLAHVREADALVEVVRFFVDDNIIHVSSKIDPLDDKTTIETELLLADMEVVGKRADKAKSDAKSGTKDKVKLADLLARLQTHLEAEHPARDFTVNDEEERKLLDSFQLLTAKRILYVANVAENEVHKITPAQAAEVLKVKPEEVVVLSAKLECELAELDSTERSELLSSYDLPEAGLSSLARAAYTLLGLQSFYTAGEQEARAWTIHKGNTAPQAAGEIHTDFEKGFIRAEVATYEDFVALGGWSGVREGGKLRVEGKEYVMRDGDVCFFLFNV